MSNFYPRSPCGERRLYPMRAFEPIGISIHALLAESDVTTHKSGACPMYISIHALLAESDRGLLHHRQQAKYFYPRSPCGERRHRQYSFDQHFAISIHALLAESDRCPRRHETRRNDFYPRSPCGERRYV